MHVQYADVYMNHLYKHMDISPQVYWFNTPACMELPIEAKLCLNTYDGWLKTNLKFYVVTMDIISQLHKTKWKKLHRTNNYGFLLSK